MPMHTIRLLLFLLLIASGATGAGDGVQALLDAAPRPAGDAAALRARIEAIGAALRGRPYVRDPLGEGVGAPVDDDPRFRLDAFDCVTYVETVLALARSPSAAAVPAQLQAIRYGGETIAFEQRNHLPTLDWLPNLLRRGIASDVSAGVAGDAALARLVVGVDRGRVIARLARGRIAPVADRRRATLRYLDKRTLYLVDTHGRFAGARDEVVARIVPGDVLLVVAPGAPGLQQAARGEAISHLGFAARGDGGGLAFRSATTRPPAGVRDEPLAQFLRRAAGSRATLGVVILAPEP